MAGPQNYGPNLNTIRNAGENASPEYFQMPPDYASLLGTMAAAGLLPLSLAQGATQTVDTADQARQAAQAQQSATQAGQAYTQAAAQPLPPTNDTISTSLANAASVLGGTSDYRKANELRIQQQHDDLASKRVENLKALKDNYDQQASAAERLGNTQLAGELRAKSEAQAKAAMVLLQGMRGSQQSAANDQKQAESNRRLDETNAMKLTLQQMKDEADRAKAQAKSDKDLEVQSALDPLINKTDYGNYINIDLVPAKYKIEALRRAKQDNLAVVDKKSDATIHDIQTARENFQTQVQAIMPYLPAGDGSGPEVWMSRAGNAAHILALKAGGDSTINAFDAMWANTVRAMRGQAGAGGLRINKSEIERALVWDRPNIMWDTQPILEQKMKNWEILARHGTEPLLSKDLRGRIDTKFMTAAPKIKVMGPDGVVTEMKWKDAQKVLGDEKSGYARVLEEPGAGGATTSAGTAPTQADSDYVKSLGISP